ncbi:hypothetical protein VCUG_00099 [Vavraia culicis subsp. floridensis]|uniref:Uncharacterized protein n=1 Tax=Vavraia culicis (isolate floridensis) TaxID=948595 RepID=L2GZI5_VAVCU|nr:uncharacterized protein VCUG_00099 [Vavraia culicis subsp. floridensis]ELA48490.1 hypothetical protein VCUG_00099 [Vavraia culicis subsp. floridensis]
MGKEVSDRTVLKQIEEINSHKANNVNYYNHLINLEGSVDQVSLFVSIQACTVLCEDFYVYLQETRAMMYVERGISKFDEIIKLCLIEKKDFYFLIECLSRMLIIKVKITNDLNILSEYRSFLQINSEGIFNFLVDLRSENIEIRISTDNTVEEQIFVEGSPETVKLVPNNDKLLVAMDFISTSEQFDVFLFYFGLFYDPACKAAYLSRLTDLRKRFERTLLIQAILDTEYLSELMDYAMKQKNGLNELSTIFMICLKINELNTFKIIIIDFLKITSILTDEEATNLRLITTSLIKNLNKEIEGRRPSQMYDRVTNAVQIGEINFLLDIGLKDFVDWDDLVRFLYVQKDYALILCLTRRSIKVERKILFACYLFTGDIFCAETLYEEELNQRFTVKTCQNGSETSFDEMEANEIFGESICSNDLIDQAQVFMLFVKKGKISSAFNLIEKIDGVEEFILCIKFLVSHNRQLLKEVICIGIKKFHQNYNFLRISISILHLEEIAITADERANLILELYFNDDDELAVNLWPDKTFIYNILYNNTLDVENLNLKCRLLEEIKLMSTEEDTLFLFLYVIREIEQRTLETDAEKAESEGKAVECLQASIDNLLIHLFGNIGAFKSETLILLYDYYKHCDKDKSELAFNSLSISDLSENNLHFLCDITDDIKIVQIIQVMKIRQLLSAEVLNTIYVRFAAYGIYNLIALCDELEMIEVDFKSRVLLDLLRTKLQHLGALRDPFLKKRILHFLSE